MAGLTLDDTVGNAPTVLKDRDANNVVTVTLTPPEIFGDYTINLGLGDGWTIFAPDDHPGGPPALAPGNGAGFPIVAQTFTPRVSGRYLVKLRAHDLATGLVLSEFTCLYEVGTAYDAEALPAPQERDEYEDEQGWSRTYESHLSSVEHQLGGRILVRAVNNSGSLIPYGSVGRVDSYKRYKEAGFPGDAMSLHLKGIVAAVLTANGTQVDINTPWLGMALESVGVGEVGSFLVRGLAPLDTSTFFSVGEALLISDVGAVGSVIGSNVRVCGKVVLPGAASLMSTASGGVVFFDGEPSTSAFAVPKTDNYEHCLGFNEVNALDTWLIAGGAALNAAEVAPGAGTIAVAAALEVIAYVATPAADGQVQVYNFTDGEVMGATIPVSAVVPTLHTVPLTIGAAAGNLKNNGKKVYELRLKRDAFTVPLDRVILLKASLQFTITTT